MKVYLMSSLVHDKETGKQLPGNSQMSSFQLMVFSSCRSLYPFWASHLVCLLIQQVFISSRSSQPVHLFIPWVLSPCRSSCSMGLLVQQVFSSSRSSYPAVLLIQWVFSFHGSFYPTCFLISHVFLSSSSSHPAYLLIS